MYKIKPEELSILSCEKGPRPRAEAFFTAIKTHHYINVVSWSDKENNVVVCFNTASTTSVLKCD